MTASKDTASFFENGTTEQFDYCYNLYPEVLKLKAEKRSKKPQELIRLDQWYQNELPKLIKSRGKDAHMEYDELVQTMKWKQARGKFYPQLSYLVKVNTPRAVAQETKKAFRKLPNLEQAITALSNLKGVGTTMASALLAAASPDSAPFMADECLMAIPEIEGIDYTTKEYLNFVQHIQSTVERLNKQAGGDKPFWSPHRVELALWAHYVANDLSPELLDEMPGPGAGGGVNTNGSAGKTKSDVKILDGDDTNDADDDADADDESSGTAGRAATINTITTESETDNENTNSTPLAGTAANLQDGDSNFVSNDSTSQEPIIDENTTQTTATTSTDDGDVGTPLATDSESSLEAPLKSSVKTAADNKNITITKGSAAAADIVEPPATELPKSQNIKEICNDDDDDDNNKTTTSTAESDEKSIAVVVGNGNGNGTLLASSGVIVAVDNSLDGENSSCLRSSSLLNEGPSEEEEEEEDDSNSNSRSCHKSVTPIIGGSSLNDGSATNTTDNDSTLSSAAGGGIPTTIVGQKRSALNCDGDDTTGSSIGLDSNITPQPELKKIRNE